MVPNRELAKNRLQPLQTHGRHPSSLQASNQPTSRTVELANRATDTNRPSRTLKPLSKAHGSEGLRTLGWEGARVHGKQCCEELIITKKRNSKYHGRYLLFPTLPRTHAQAVETVR